jgi:hypothetical protein
LLEENGSNLTIKSDAVKWIEGDTFYLPIYFYENPVSDPTPVRITSSSIVLSGKLSSELDNGDPLFSASTFVEVDKGSGLYAQRALLSLNTSEISSALDSVTATEKKITCLVDVEVQNLTNSQRMTFRFSVEIYRQVHKNDDVTPTPSEPTYPGADSLVIKYRGSVSLTQGNTSVTVDLTAHGLSIAPATVLLSMRKPSADGGNLAVVLDDATLSATAMTAHFSGEIPGSGYKLDYLVIP